MRATGLGHNGRMPAAGSAITTIVFDFDGVLADTERLHLRAFQQVFAERGWTLDEAAYFDQYLGYDDRGLVLAFSDDQTLGLHARDVQTLVSAKGKVFGDFVAAGDVVFPNTRACVERMAARFTLGIASGALKHEIVTILEAANLHQFFPVIVGADDVTACKPAPEPYLTAARRLRCCRDVRGGRGLASRPGRGPHGRYADGRHHHHHGGRVPDARRPCHS